MISFSPALGGHNLNKSRWRGEKHGGNRKEKKREHSCLQFLSFVDHCRRLEVSTIAVSVAMNSFLDIL
jgi:hypothetical protein